MRDSILSATRGPLPVTGVQAPLSKVEDEFDPRAFPNFRLWLDASVYGMLWQDTAMSNVSWGKNSPVGRWHDRSGNGNDAQQATAPLKPLMNPGQQNGLNIVSFSTSQWMPLGPFDGNPPFTIFAVVKPSSAATSKFVIAGNLNGPVLYINGGGAVILAKNGIANLCTSPNPLTLGAVSLICVTYDGEETAMRTNGVDNGSADGGVVPSGNVTQLGSTDGGTNNFDGSILEIRWYGAVLTSLQIAAHERDLNSKWRVY